MKNNCLRILNLYAGIGGNRKLWGNKHKITAVELDPEIARIYEGFFPQDKVIVDNAHLYLLKHYNEFNFIWSSPPCQTHSSFRHNICVRFTGTKPEYPDMRLYQEILFLKHYFKGKYVVENVKPYYRPLIEPANILQRHLFWTNFKLADMDFKKSKLRAIQIPQLSKLYGFDLSSYKLSNKRQVLRNCVLPELGKYVFDQSFLKQ